ncbi:MAG: KamA family radical SAM protein, partial [Proteobacteria bacterium]
MRNDHEGISRVGETWQDELRRAVTSVAELSGQGYAFLDENPGVAAVEAKYRTLVPPYYLSLINKADPEDPIAKIAFPSAAEIAPSVAGRRDPIGDLEKKAASRLTHRYPDRALLHVTNLCPMYCRFCFRKNLMNEREEELYRGDFEEAFAYLAAHPEIEELILTGGDPWMLGNEKLRRLVDDVAARAPAIKRFRFHTRMPVTLPSRITPELIEAILRPGRFQTIVVTHFNHPQEVSAEAREGLRQLRRAGVLTLNQGVLLKGVNDNAATLRKLYLALGEEGVMPYYLHHCDLVEGGEHFRTTIEAGR